MNAMCYLWGPHCLIVPMTNCHVAIEIVQFAKLCCCCVTMWHVSAEVALPWLATWHVGETHMSGQYSGGAHMAEVDQ
jgi:hypothetical protein